MRPSAEGDDTDPARADEPSQRNVNRKPKEFKIGLRQAKRFCQLPAAERLSLISDGLPIILNSAQGLWEAARQLPERSRAGRILEGFAEEEAAKILILLDVVRCPPKLVASQISMLIGRFYEHLTRLIYAQATSWKPMHLAQLREYADRERRSHYVEGHAGEYIIPNWTVYERESTLYADVEGLQDGSLGWSEPREFGPDYPSFARYTPRALRVTQAMQRLGLFSLKGLQATAEIWGNLEYKDKERSFEDKKFINQLLSVVDAEGLILDTAGELDVAFLKSDWQIPMYNLDFSPIVVTRAELEAEQEAEYRSMVGDY
jgi:hypothetical protein